MLQSLMLMPQAKWKVLLPNSQLPKRAKDSNIKALILIDITVVVGPIVSGLITGTSICTALPRTDNSQYCWARYRYSIGCLQHSGSSIPTIWSQQNGKYTGTFLVRSASHHLLLSKPDSPSLYSLISSRLPVASGACFYRYHPIIQNQSSA